MKAWPWLLAIGAGAAGFYLWQSKRREAWSVGAVDAIESVGASISSAISTAMESMGMVKISAMKSVDVALLSNRNVLAILTVIRRGEGTLGIDGYRTLYGGALFTGFADHPRKAVTRWGRTSTAAGAYQFLSKVWDETKSAMSLPDFSPRSQDLAALGRIAARGALADILAGRFDAAIAKLNREWASLPGSPYGQGTLTRDTAKQVYIAAGGTIAGTYYT